MESAAASKLEEKSISFNRWSQALQCMLITYCNQRWKSEDWTTLLMENNSRVSEALVKKLSEGQPSGFEFSKERVARKRKLRNFINSVVDASSLPEIYLVESLTVLEDGHNKLQYARTNFLTDNKIEDEEDKKDEEDEEDKEDNEDNEDKINTQGSAMIDENEKISFTQSLKKMKRQLEKVTLFPNCRMCCLH